MQIKIKIIYNTFPIFLYIFFLFFFYITPTPRALSRARKPQWVRGLFFFLCYSNLQNAKMLYILS